jgi:CHAT domain-containing protein/tetratricopeptide (TPR) repeat protein
VKAPWQRLLVGEDAQRAHQLEMLIAEARIEGKLPEARQAARTVLEIRTRLQGADHYQTADTGRLVHLLDGIAALPPEAQKELAQVTKLNADALRLSGQGHYMQALALLRRALAAHTRHLGEEDSQAAALYHALGFLLGKVGKPAQAQPFLTKALVLRIRLLGADHTWTGQSYGGVACNLDEQGNHAAAGPLHRRALAICLAAHGADHPLMAQSCNNLAYNLAAQGMYAAAAPLYERALVICQQILGEDHIWTAGAYSNLAFNQYCQGKHDAATPLYQRSLLIHQRRLREDHPMTANCLSNLALNLAAQGKYEEAVRLHEKALSIRQREYGEESNETANSYNNLAVDLDFLGKHAAAAPLHKKALAIAQNTVGEDHPHTAQGWKNLAHNLEHQGEFAAAAPLYEKALAIRRRALGEHHPDTANSYHCLARNLWSRGCFAQAEPHWRAAAGSFEKARLRANFTGLDRATFGDQRSPLPWLAACLARLGRPVDAWRACEANLARGLLDELSARPLTPSEQNEQQVLTARLTRLDKQITALLDSSKATEAGRNRLVELQQERTAVQAQFTRFEADLAARYDLAAGKVCDLSGAQACLADDAALVVWIDLKGLPKEAEPSGEHWGCVVRRTGPPVWVKLPGSGAGGAWTEDDQRLRGPAYRALSRRPEGPADWAHLAQRLYAQRLAPLEEHLPRPAVKHLIVLPSTALAGVPVEALTDRYTVSYAPSATLFALLQKKRRQNRPGRRSRPASLLAVGDPVFAPAPARQQDVDDLLRRTRGPAFAALPGTFREVQAVARLFARDRVTMLVGSDACEQRLAELASAGRLRDYRFIHLATHAVVDRARSMQSALILAQDRLPDPLVQIQAGKECHDGRLTAEQIRRKWKLDADLVTLSACQTGLGQYRGGEGYLGFSQALFLAGTRSMVLSLWQVDDRATALLMRRFYQNLLGAREGLAGPLSRAAALREAKHWLRGASDAEVHRELTSLPRGYDEVRRPAPPSAHTRPYEHPYYWAAFILIGDPK